MANPDIGCRHRRRPPILGGRSRSGASEPGDRERGGPSNDTTEREGMERGGVALDRGRGGHRLTPIRRRYFAAPGTDPSTGPRRLEARPARPLASPPARHRRRARRARDRVPLVARPDRHLHRGWQARLQPVRLRQQRRHRAGLGPGQRTPRTHPQPHRRTRPGATAMGARQADRTPQSRISYRLRPRSADAPARRRWRRSPSRCACWRP